MKVLALVMALVSLNAFGANYQENITSYTIPTHTGDGARVYYNCDSVEQKVTDMLVTMGAVVSDVRCTGGLDRFGNFHRAAHVTAVYETINSKLSGNVATAVGMTNLRERGNCHLYNTSFKAVEKNFEIYTKKMRNCRKANDRTRIKLTVLKALN